MAAVDTVLFDLGNVLIEWDPRHLYRKLFDDEAEMEAFLTDVCSPEWNSRQDAGRTIADARAEAIARHPEHADNINAYHDRFNEMLPGPIPGTADLLTAVHATTPVYALTNWSAETFPLARERFAFLELFAGILVSGEEGMIKPDARIFELTIERFSLAPEQTLFIDDSLPNITAAAALGFQTHHFAAAPALAEDLQRLGVLSPEGNRP